LTVSKKLSEEKIKQIREMVKDGLSRFQVAKKTGLSANVVSKYTRDLPKPRDKTPCIKVREIKFLTRFLRKGYALLREGGNILLKLASEASDD